MKSKKGIRDYMKDEPAIYTKGENKVRIDYGYLIEPKKGWSDDILSTFLFSMAICPKNNPWLAADWSVSIKTKAHIYDDWKPTKQKLKEICKVI